MNHATTHDYDPRYDRAQTIEGAKARYVAEELPEYSLKMLEADLERLLDDGAWSDRENVPEGIRHAATCRPEEFTLPIRIDPSVNTIEGADPDLISTFEERGGD